MVRNICILDLAVKNIFLVYIISSDSNFHASQLFIRLIQTAKVAGEI